MKRIRFIPIGVAIVVLLLIAPSAQAAAGDVTTIAGTGIPGFAGDGGPALAAQLFGPYGITAAPDGTIYVADSSNFRARKISPGGIITTVAGNGVPTQGDGDGDGGPATDARLGSVFSVALDPAANVLYLADLDNFRIRQVNLATGIITNFAGTGGFGFSGDGGPAANAELSSPEGVAVDSAGNVYIADALNCRIRKVDTSGIIQTIAGSGSLAAVCVSAGDGGPATAARFALPRRVAVDSAGNVFVLDAGSLVRRIDAATGIITTVAGGGSVVPGSGSATTMDIGNASNLAVDDAGDLFISSVKTDPSNSMPAGRIFKVDLASGMLSVFAGTGLAGFSGDGGPATAAAFGEIGALAFKATGELLVVESDHGHNRIRSIEPAATGIPLDVIISALTSQPFLNSLLAVEGSLALVNVDGREYLIVPNLTRVGLDVTVTGNNQLLVLDLHALQRAGRNVEITGNLALTTLDLSSLTAVGGALTITGNPRLSAVLVSGVTSVRGDLSIIGSAATVIDLGSLTEAGGSVTISGNTSANAIALSLLGTVAGSVTINANTSANVVDLSSLATVAGSVTITDNSSAAVSLGLLGTVAGSVHISGNTSAGVVDLNSLVSSGSVEITGNTAATAVGLGALGTVAGSITITDNSSAAVSLGLLGTVAGAVTLETSGTGTFSLGTASPAGSMSLTTEGYTSVFGATASGATTLENTRPEAVMRLRIAAATFVTPVAFTLTRIDPLSLTPESGVAAGGGAATVDPVAAYSFSFGVPTLNRDAALSFEVQVDGLDGATRLAFLAALEAGTATLATKGDAAGASYQAFPLCTGGATPVADGCVLVEKLDAAGQPTTGTPTVVRFTNVVGHFSTWAVALVTPRDSTPPVIAPTVSGTLGGAGFYTSNVSVAWAVEDAESAITQRTGCAAQTVASDTAGITFTCEATSAGGTASKSITIKRDTTAPSLTVPADLTVDATGPGGSPVTYAASAIDTLDPSPRLACSPASGNRFPIGTTTVGCTATDAAGNSATRVFSIRVRGAAEQIANLVDKTLAFLELPALEASLKTRLEAAAQALIAGNKPAACKALSLYITAVRLAPANVLTAAQKSALIGDATRIRAVIGCS